MSGEVSVVGMVSSLGVDDSVAGFPGLLPVAFWQRLGLGASAQSDTARQCRLPFSEGPVSLASCYSVARPGSGSKSIRVREDITVKGPGALFVHHFKASGIISSEKCIA